MAVICVNMYIQIYAVPLLWLYIATTFSDSHITVYPGKNSEDYNQLKDVKHVLVDEEYDRIYFSALDSLFSLSIKTSELKKYNVSPSESVLDTCKKDRRWRNSKTPKCGNYIKILQFHTKDRVLVCGANIDLSRCHLFNRSSTGLTDVKEISGFIRVPDVEDVQATLIYDDPYTLIGTRSDSLQVITKQAGDDLDGILKAFGTSGEDKILKDPNFISSYVLDNSNYTYFFFTEIGIEIPRRQQTIARVATLCKYEVENNIQAPLVASYLKSELLCTTTGKDGKGIRYYNQLRKTFKISVYDDKSSRQEDFLYAVFTSPAWEGSAICRYRVSDIVNLLSTSTKLYILNRDSSWNIAEMGNTEPFRRHPCNKPFKLEYPDLDIPEKAKNPLLATSVGTSDEGHALFTEDQKRFTSIYVDDVHLFNDSSDIGTLSMFVGTYIWSMDFRHSGQLLERGHPSMMHTGNFPKKYFLPPNMETYMCILRDDGELMQIAVNNYTKTPFVVETLPLKTKEPIHSIKRYKDKLYLAATSGLAVVNLHRCEQKVTCELCISRRDPYCGWDRKKNRCAASNSIPFDDLIFDYLIGNTSICPQPKNKIQCEIKLVQPMSTSGAKLQCLASSEQGNTNPKITEWRIVNNPVIPLNDPRFLVNGIKTERSSLSISNFTSTLAGTYECVIELSAEKNVCSYKLEALHYNTTSSTNISPEQTTATKTTENTVVVVTTAVPSIGKDESYYKNLFYGFLVAFVITFILLLLLLCLVLLVRAQQRTDAEIDGLKNNGHIANGHVSWFKKYKMNRNDSASRELIKKKNRNQVYRDTTLEMNATVPMTKKV